MRQFGYYEVMKREFAPYEPQNNEVGEQVNEAVKEFAELSPSYTLLGLQELYTAVQNSESNPEYALNFLKTLLNANRQVFDFSNIEKYNGEVDSQVPESWTPQRWHSKRMAESAQVASTLHEVLHHLYEVSECPADTAELLGIEWISEEDILTDQYDILRVAGYALEDIDDMTNEERAKAAQEAYEQLKDLPSSELNTRLHESYLREREAEEMVE